MGEQERIKKDIVLFDQNIKKIHSKLSGIEPLVLARQYYHDAQYYLGRQDYFTAFGCINYAHGLLDAVNFLAQSL